jgi:hypothetical protein
MGLMRCSLEKGIDNRVFQKHGFVKHFQVGLAVLAVDVGEDHGIASSGSNDSLKCKVSAMRSMD